MDVVLFSLTMKHSRRLYGPLFGIGPLAVKKPPLKDGSFHNIVKISCETQREIINIETRLNFH